MNIVQDRKYDAILHKISDETINNKKKISDILALN